MKSPKTFADVTDRKHDRQGFLLTKTNLPPGSSSLAEWSQSLPLWAEWRIREDGRLPFFPAKVALPFRWQQFLGCLSEKKKLKTIRMKDRPVLQWTSGKYD
jgi:hypothetical protein